jgi:hypothetical protein
MTLRLRRPTANEQQAGVVCHFFHDDDEGWTAQGTVSRNDQGLLGISRIEVTPPPGGTINARVLRAIPTGRIIDFVIERAHELGVPYEPSEPLPPKHEPGRPGRAPLSDDLLRDVAERYLAETGPDKPRGAVQRLAKHFGQQSGTVSRWVWRARKDGWLGPAVPGREGAEPGPRLLQARATKD